MENDEFNSSKFGENPLGSWDDLKPTFSNQVKALLKKNILIRIRNISSIIEIIFAFIIPIVGYLDYSLGETAFASSSTPQINKVNVNSMTEWFLAFGSATKVACLPDKPMMHYLIGNTTFLQMIINGGTITMDGTSITLPGTQISYVNKFKDLKNIIQSTNNNNIGFEWENIDSPDALIKPSIKVYFQSVFGSPQTEIYFQIRDSLINLRYSSEGQVADIQQMKYMNVKFSKSEFAHPKIIQRMIKMAFPFGLLTPIGIILATLPDMELILSEKESHVTALSFLMGMTEFAYWFTNFIVSFIICFVLHLFISLILAFWFGMNGNDFSVILVLSILFVIAEIWFQFFITTLMKDSSKGKLLTIVLIMATIILSLFFQFVTLKEKSTLSTVLNNIVCLFPISAYELFIMQGYISNVADLPLYKWNDMNNKSFICPPWIPLMWCAIDSVLYFVLFLICNAYVPRGFGISTISISNLFKKKSMSFRNENTSDVSVTDEPAIKLDNLTKVYHGTRKVKALNSVSFDVNKGEVIVMIGPNGAGKSTLINCISGGIKPTEGTVTILGENTIHNLGVCYQNNVLIPQLSVQEHFELFGAFRGISKETLNSSIDFLSANMQLSHILKNRAGDLSGGQKRKLCICLSLLGNPEVVLMDEPTAGVDVQACQLIWKIISNLKNTTSFITSHALEEAEVVSSRLFILSEGILRFIGTSTELREQFKCGYELRVETDNNNAQLVLDFVKKYIPEAKIADDRNDVILMPVCLSIGKLLLDFREKQSELGVISYSFAVQQLEDMLLKSLENNN